MALWWASGSSFPCPNPHPNSSQVGELVDVSPSLPYPNSSQVGELVDVSPDVWLHLSAGATGARGVEMLLPAPLSFGSWLRAQSLLLFRPMSSLSPFLDAAEGSLSRLGSQLCHGLVVLW